VARAAICLIGSNTTKRLFHPYGFALFTAATLCGVLPGFAREAIAVKPATIWYTEQVTVHSGAVGRDFLIQVPAQSSHRRARCRLYLSARRQQSLRREARSSRSFYGKNCVLRSSAAIRVCFPCAADICSPSLWAETNLLHEDSSFPYPGPSQNFRRRRRKEEKQFGKAARMVRNAEDLAARYGTGTFSPPITCFPVPAIWYGLITF
jgi:hypothetical protein